MKKLIIVNDFRGNKAIINTEHIVSASINEFRNQDFIEVTLDNNDIIVCNHTAEEIYELIYPPTNP